MSAAFSSVHAATVKAVIDGDTVILNDGRHIRLIGIDTPELGRKGKPSQPFAKQAKQYLLQRIKSSRFKVTLEQDSLAKDRYGRTLAHLFLPSGENLSTSMLSSGFATLLLFPPNTRHAQEYSLAQSLAREAGKKRWLGLEKTRKPAKNLSKQDTGFGLFTGKVTSIRHGRNTTWLILNNHLTLKILSSEAPEFGTSHLKALRHQEIEVAGKLYFYKGQPRIRLRHPYQLEIIDKQ